MDSREIRMTTLFQQLGLPEDPASISAFIASHQLEADLPLHQAAYWNEAQRQFLRDALKQDSDWTMVVDALKWAAYTYIIAALGSLATLFYYISMASGRR